MKRIAWKSFGLFFSLFVLFNENLAWAQVAAPMPAPADQTTTIFQSLKTFFKIHGQSIKCPGEKGKLADLAEQNAKLDAEIAANPVIAAFVEGGIVGSNSPWGLYSMLASGVGSDEVPPVHIAIVSRAACDELKQIEKDKPEHYKSVFGDKKVIYNYEGEVCALYIDRGILGNTTINRYAVEIARIVNEKRTKRCEPKAPAPAPAPAPGSMGMQESSFGSFATFAGDGNICPSVGFPVAGQPSRCELFYTNWIAPGDANLDGVTDSADRKVVVNQLSRQAKQQLFSATVRPVAPNTAPDIDGDGMVSSSDLSLLDMALRYADPGDYLDQARSAGYLVSLLAGTAGSTVTNSKALTVPYGAALQFTFNAGDSKRRFLPTECELDPGNVKMKLSGGTVGMGSATESKVYEMVCKTSVGFRAMRYRAINVTVTPKPPVAAPLPSPTPAPTPAPGAKALSCYISAPVQTKLKAKVEVGVVALNAVGTVTRTLSGNVKNGLLDTSTKGMKSLFGVVNDSRGKKAECSFYVNVLP